MALNLSPEPGVKLTKKDRAHVLKKMKKGWKATCMIPDYVFDDNGNIQIASDKNRRVVKIVKFKDDGIYIEKALKSKNLRLTWDKIAVIGKSNEIRDGMELKLHDGKYITFSIYNSYKIKQITQFIAEYINDKKMNNANMYA